MNVLKSLMTVSCMVVFSRVLGFVRDLMIARFFGAGIMADAFFVAFRLPNLLRRIFAEGAFSQSFVPILVEYRGESNYKIIRDFVGSMLGWLILLLILVIILGIFFAPWLIFFTAPGFTYELDKFTLTVDILRIVFPYIFLISLSSFFGFILNVWNEFLVPAFISILLNFSMIVFLIVSDIFFTPSVIILSWGVLFGGLLQLVYLLPYIKKMGMLVFPKIQLYNYGVLRVLRLLLPSILGVFTGQLSLIINTIFASFLVSGSISWMYYADRLVEFPIGVLGVALGTILLPSLSKSIYSNSYTEYYCLMDWGLRLCFLLSVPSTIILSFLSKPLVVLLFQYGRFTSFDVLMTQRALIAYSIGLVALILVKVLSSGFYSRKDIITPIRVNIFTFLITQFMNFIFIGPFKHVGLSLAIGLGACFNAGLLYWFLRRRKLFIPQPGWLLFFFKIFVSSFIMVFVVISLLIIIPDFLYINIFEKIFWCLIAIGISFFVYFYVLWLLGIRLKNFLIFIL